MVQQFCVDKPVRSTGFHHRAGLVLASSISDTMPSRPRLVV